MSKGGRGLTEDEKQLWRRVAARVKARRSVRLESDVADAPMAQAGPVGAQARPQTPHSPPKPRAPAPPQNRGAEKRVRRGRLDIGGTLDLHGHNQTTGRAALTRFLLTSQRRGVRTVIVITGVGRAGHGILKQRLPVWLAEPDLRPLVSGFAQAHRAHGGEGAFYVFLRASRTT